MIADRAATVVGTTGTVLAAPGAGLALILQTISIFTNGQVGECSFVSGTQFAEFTLNGAAPVSPLIFPGGFKCPTNTAVTFTAPGTVRIDVTYSIGPG